MEVSAPIRSASPKTNELRLRADDGVELFSHRWLPAGAPRGVVHLVHGMAEHAGRYARSAQALVGAGFAVYAPDHRGHGRTAVSSQELGYFADRHGWRRLVADVQCVEEHIEAELPGVPRFLLGHSMGSLVVRDYLCRYASRTNELSGVVLSGTSGNAGLRARGGALVAHLERLRLGPRGKSQLLERLSTGQFNRNFEPARTTCDWLSRDEVEVDRYLADRLCGFPLTVQGWLDLLDGVIRTEQQENLRCLRKSLPYYVFSGDRDPVGGSTKGVKWFVERLNKVGVSDVILRFYPGGRHEMFNETNRDEVHRDLIAWFEAVLARGAG